MDKDMRQKCILCEQLKPYIWHQSATTFICADCRADAARGRNAESELSRLRAANAELRKILARALAEEKCGADGVFFTVATECTEGRCWHFQARAALSRAEQAKPEVDTCVWKPTRKTPIPSAHETSCGAYLIVNEFFTGNCPVCGKRIEVAGKAEGRQG